MSSICLKEILTFDSYLISDAIQKLGLNRTVDFEQVHVEKAILNENKNIFMYFNDKNLEKLPGKLVSKYILTHLISSNKENLFQSQVPYFDYLSRCQIYKLSKCVCGCCPIFNNNLTFKICGEIKKVNIPVLQLSMDKKSILKMFEMLNLDLKNIWISHYYTQEAFKEIMFLSHNDINLFHIIFNTLKKPLVCVFRANVCRCSNCYISKHVYWTTVHGIPHVNEDSKGTFICSLTLNNCTIKHYHDIPWLTDFGNTYFIGRRLLDTINTTTPQFSGDLDKILSKFKFDISDYFLIMTKGFRKSYFNKKYGMLNMIKFVKTYNTWALDNGLSKIRWHCYKSNTATKQAEEFVKELNSNIMKVEDDMIGDDEVFENWDEMLNSSINIFSEVLVDSEPLPVKQGLKAELASSFQANYQEKVDNLSNQLSCLKQFETSDIATCEEYIDKVKDFSKSSSILDMSKKLTDRSIEYMLKLDPNSNTGRRHLGFYEDAIDKTWPKMPKSFYHEKGDICVLEKNKTKPPKIKKACTLVTNEFSGIKRDTFKVMTELRGFAGEEGVKEIVDYEKINKEQDEDFVLKVLGYSVERDIREGRDPQMMRANIVFHDFKKEEVKIKKEDSFSNVLTTRENPLINLDNEIIPLRRFKKFIRNKFLTELKSKIKYTNYTMNDNFEFIKIKNQKHLGNDYEHKNELNGLLLKLMKYNEGWTLTSLMYDFNRSEPQHEFKNSLQNLTKKIINTYKKRILINIRNRKNQSRLLTLKDNDILSLCLGIMTNEYNLIKNVKDRTVMRSTEVRKLYRNCLIFDKIY